MTLTKFGPNVCAKYGGNRNLRYVQPPVREMIRPPVAYQQPTIPVDCETVHKASFLPIDPDVAMQCRLPPAKPETNLNMNRDVKIDSETVTSISYPPILGLQKCSTIVPPGRIVMGTGPMQKLTTQKHDYVLKRGLRTGPIRPLDGMTPSTEPLESDTTTRLSFPPPDGFIASQNFKPIIPYKHPDIDMDLETCHKLSFQLPRTRPREIPLWAIKPRFVKPLLPVASDTVQKCSYRPPGVFVESNEKCDCDDLASVEYYAKAGL